MTKNKKFKSEIYENFKWFLKENRALTKFINGLIKQSKFKSCNSYVNSFVDADFAQKELIMQAFTWKNTNEPEIYWSNLDSKWRSCAKNINKQTKLDNYKSIW